MDYYFSDNEGHIFFKCTYNGPGPYSVDLTAGSLFDEVVGRSSSLLETARKNVLHIDQGAAFAQAIFIPYGLTYDDNATATRNGGFGSTDKGA